MKLNVNGMVRDIRSPAHARLSDVLRDELKLTGTKVGCNAGDCGACSVSIDGHVACSCLVAVGQVDGAEITTVEGLTRNGTMSALQQSFLHHGAAQCGICTPGMLLTAVDLLDRVARPSRSHVENALGGVLCRCTGYAKIVDAVMDVADGSKVILPAAGEAVGAAIARLDGVAKVDGREAYGADVVPEDALHLAVIRSPHHRARFTIGDTAAFMAQHPGVVAVFTAKDVPGLNRFG
ncbi:MAG: aldehyde oxidase, partial [Phyllobacteriaceae bacterium]|nr:aldehyde oxidase [Phyllobacteriaceae bacterium]